MGNSRSHCELTCMMMMAGRRLAERPTECEDVEIQVIMANLALNLAYLVLLGIIEQRRGKTAWRWVDGWASETETGHPQHHPGVCA